MPSSTPSNRLTPPSGFVDIPDAASVDQRSRLCAGRGGPRAPVSDRGMSALAVAPPDFSKIFGVPAEVGAVVREFRSCELSTFARDGTPVTWPTMPFFEPDRQRFLITSSVGLAQKALNIR